MKKVSCPLLQAWRIHDQGVLSTALTVLHIAGKSIIGARSLVN